MVWSYFIFYDRGVFFFRELNEDDERLADFRLKCHPHLHAVLPGFNWRGSGDRAFGGITGQGWVCAPQGSCPSSRLGLDGVISHLSRIQSYQIKSIRRNREAGLWCQEVFEPPDKHNNICVKSSHKQEDEETEDSFRNMECQDNVPAGKTGGGMQGHG